MVNQTAEELRSHRAKRKAERDADVESRTLEVISLQAKETILEKKFNKTDDPVLKAKYNRQYEKITGILQTLVKPLVFNEEVAK